jgi:hypothetical protein
MLPEFQILFSLAPDLGLVSLGDELLYFLLSLLVFCEVIRFFL